MPEPESGEMSRYDFQVAYEGADRRSHSMDVQQLAPALLAFGKLIREANTEINGKRAQVKVLVVSDFEHKCFNINFEVLQTIFQTLKTMLQDEDVKTAKEILEWIGLAVAGSGLGLFGYLKWKNGRKVTNVQTLRDVDKAGMVSVQVEGDHNPVTVHNHVYNLSENPKVLDAVRETLAPLDDPEIEELQFRKGDKPIVTITEQDAREIAASADVAIEESKLLDEPSVVTAFLRVYAPVFDERAKYWRFHYGQEHIYADISETSIAKDAVARGGSFVDDLYKVKMEISQHITKSEQIRNEYKILKVLSFKQAPQQISLALPPPEPEKPDGTSA